MKTNKKTSYHIDTKNNAYVMFKSKATYIYGIKGTCKMHY